MGYLGALLGRLGRGRLEGLWEPSSSTLGALLGRLWAVRGRSWGSRGQLGALTKAMRYDAMQAMQGTPTELTNQGTSFKTVLGPF